MSLLALMVGLVTVSGVQAAPSHAADSVFADGYVADLSGGGAWGSWVALTQIGVRSLDGHSSCWQAYDGSTYTNIFCTNDLGNSSYGAVVRIPQCFSGWSGHTVNMRCRQYW